MDMAQNMEGESVELLLDSVHSHLSAVLPSNGETDTQQKNYLAARASIRKLGPHLQAGDQERRGFAIDMRIAMNGLSFIPNEAFRQKVPTENQLHALIVAIDSLRPPTLSREHRRFLEDVLELSGIHIGLELENIADMDWHSVPH